MCTKVLTLCGNCEKSFAYWAEKTITHPNTRFQRESFGKGNKKKKKCYFKVLVRCVDGKREGHGAYILSILKEKGEIFEGNREGRRELGYK